MKAIRIAAYGGPEQMKLSDAPMPTCGSHEVLVRVIAAGVNPVDWKIRSGQMAAMLQLPLPLTLGWDVAGVVEAVGASVRDFVPGDEVFAQAGFGHGGTYAEYVALDAAEVAKKPTTLAFAQAVALPMPAQAAWAAVHDTAQVTAGQRLLIHGAAGSLGAVAVQLAKSAGAYVIATASGEGVALAASLGADEVIDYRRQAFDAVARGVDTVIDTVGGATQAASWRVLNPGGLLVATTMPPSAEAAQAVGARSAFLFSQPRGRILQRIADLVDQGRLRALVGREFALEEAARVHELGQMGQLRGKSVLHVGQP